MTLIQRRRVEDALNRGELLDPPVFPGFLAAENRSAPEDLQPTKDPGTGSTGEDIGQHKVHAPSGSATARRYLECCCAAFSKKTLAEASGLGSALLLESGSLESAVHALQEVRLLKHGDLLATASMPSTKYLKEMAELGVPSRRSDLPVRVEAHNHGSVQGYEDELLSKAHKVRRGGDIRVLSGCRKPARAGSKTKPR